jgi:polyisoprenoid-binding protein YceI
MMKFRSTAMLGTRAIAGVLAVAFILAPTAGAQAAKSTAKKLKPKKIAAIVRPKPELPVRFVVTPAGNEARYRVREQLMGANLPNDAIGTTTQVSGSILAYADGRIVKDSSKIIVNNTTLKSDKDRRDGYVQRRTMETDKYPTVEFVPTSVRGFKGPLPASGPVTFELLGDLTVHGSTHPAVWQVTAHADGQDVAGSATTAFTFKDINLDQPKVPVVLSVADTIKLEYDFRFARAAVPVAPVAKKP